MQVKVNDILTLDDGNKYIVCSKVDYNGEIFLYLVSLENDSDLKILKHIDYTDKLLEVEAQDLIQKLLPLFFENGIKNINDLRQHIEINDNN